MTAPDTPEAPRPSAKIVRHVALAVLRLLLAPGIALAMPVVHAKWGEPYLGDGQQAFGFVALFAVIGCIAAALFLASGSVAQFLLRRRAARLTVLVDLGLFLAFAGALAYGGLTAEYGHAQIPNEAVTGPADAQGRPETVLPGAGMSLDQATRRGACSTQRRANWVKLRGSRQRGCGTGADGTLSMDSRAIAS